MAQQTGIIKIKGSVDDLNFYVLNGQHVVRKLGFGFQGEAIRKSPTMVKVRQNGKEFGHCTQVGKALRMALRPLYWGHTFTFLHSRVASLCSRLKNLDPEHPRGERTVGRGLQTQEGQRLFKGFGFTPDCLPDQVLPFPQVYDATAQTLTLKGVDPKKVRFPEGATHALLQLLLLDVDFGTLRMAVAEGVPCTLQPQTPKGDVVLSLETSMAVSHFPMAFLGVRFYVESAEGLLPLKGKQAVGFGAVWV